MSESTTAGKARLTAEREAELRARVEEARAFAASNLDTPVARAVASQQADDPSDLFNALDRERAKAERLRGRVAELVAAHDAVCDRVDELDAENQRLVDAMGDAWLQLMGGHDDDLALGARDILMRALQGKGAAGGDAVRGVPERMR